MKNLLITFSLIAAAAIAFAVLSMAPAAPVYVSEPNLGANNFYAASTAQFGSNGTELSSLMHGTITVASGQTSNTLSLTGVTTSHRVFASINGTNTNSVSIIRVVPTTDSVQVILSGDPGANTTVSILAIGG